MEQPRLLYGLIIQAGDITFLPGLEVFLNSVLRNSILVQYTLPAGCVLPIAPAGGTEVGSRTKLVIIALCLIGVCHRKSALSHLCVVVVVVQYPSKCRAIVLPPLARVRCIASWIEAEAEYEAG